MAYSLFAVPLVAVLAATAHAETFDTITFSFPVTAIPQPFGNPPDVVRSINQSVVVPASPTPVNEPFFVSPGTFWIDPFGNPPGAFPPPGDVSYYFSPGGAGFVFTENLFSPRAYFNFMSAQLFTGAPTAPTFLIGTFAAQYAVPIFGYGYDAGTITISPVDTPPSTVPEPGSFLLLATGALGTVASLRRRLPASRR